ncbi:hypothetical protein [Streptomyces sp. NPDC056949]|uniref:hypothetical protein n=1 Tax=Streptomyces sp. NPDC056949 TaxID=3345976 RepID=UPI00364307A0
MANTPKRSPPQHGEGPSQYKGTAQHSWAGDVDAEKKESNPSGRRSFHPQKYAAAADEGLPTPPEKKDAAREESLRPSAKTGDSPSRSGEEIVDQEGAKGHHSHGARGLSGRPSGGKDASAYTGVDPKDETEEGKSH